MSNQPYFDPQRQNYPPQPEQNSYPQNNNAYPDYDSPTDPYTNQGNVPVQRQRPTYNEPVANRVERKKEPQPNSSLDMVTTRAWITSFIYFLLGVLEVVLGLRFIFRLFGANEGSPFINFLYEVSRPFVFIFNGIFNDQTIGRAGVFEVSTILAMLMYALIAWGIVSLVRVLFFSNMPDSNQSTATRRRRRS